MKIKNSYHHGNLKEALIFSGLEILKLKGYNSLSLRLVAKKTGVSHTAPYSHFKKKEDLYAAIAEYGFDLLIEKLLESLKNNNNSFKNIKILIKKYIYYAIENPDIYSVMFSKQINIKEYPLLLEKAHNSLFILQKQVEICQKEKYFKKSNSEHITFFIWTILHGFSEIIINDKIPSKKSENELKEKKEEINIDFIINYIFNCLINGLGN